MSGFHLEVHDNWGLPGCYAASNGNSLPTFRDIFSVPSSGVKNPKIKWNLIMTAEHCFSTSVLWQFEYSSAYLSTYSTALRTLCNRSHILGSPVFFFSSASVVILASTYFLFFLYISYTNLNSFLVPEESRSCSYVRKRRCRVIVRSSVYVTFTAFELSLLEWLHKTCLRKVLQQRILFSLSSNSSNNVVCERNSSGFRWLGKTAVRQANFGAMPAAVRSKAQVRGRQVAGIVGSNPAKGMDVRLLCLLSVV